MAFLKFFFVSREGVKILRTLIKIFKNGENRKFSPLSGKILGVRSTPLIPLKRPPWLRQLVRWRESKFFWPNTMCIVNQQCVCAESMNRRLVVVMLYDVKGATLDYCCIIYTLLGRQNDFLLANGLWKKLIIQFKTTATIHYIAQHQSQCLVLHIILKYYSIGWIFFVKEVEIENVVKRTQMWSYDGHLVALKWYFFSSEWTISPFFFVLSISYI